MSLQLKFALFGLIAFLVMVGAVAMLLRVPNGSGFVVSGAIISGAPPLQAGTSIPGTHVVSGPNISEYLVHLTKPQPLVSASQQGFHSTYQRQSTYYYPPNWIHNTKSGSGAISGGLPAATMYVLPTAIHYSFVGKDNSIYYDPGAFKHASIQGNDFTKLIPVDWVHIAVGLDNATTYVPPEVLKHIIAGPYASTDIAGDPGHRTGGPDDTTLVPGGDERHLTEGKLKSGYLTNDYVHITKGDNLSDYVPAGQHLTGWFDSSKYDPTWGGTLDHISIGPEKSTYRGKGWHDDAVGPNQTGLVNGSGSKPESQPTPPEGSH